MSCQRVMSGRRVGREAGRERVAYDVMRPKALRKRDEVVGVGSGSGRRAGVGSVRGSPYRIHLYTHSYSLLLLIICSNFDPSTSSILFRFCPDFIPLLLHFYSTLSVSVPLLFRFFVTIYSSSIPLLFPHSPDLFHLPDLLTHSTFSNPTHIPASVPLPTPFRPLPQHPTSSASPKPTHIPSSFPLPTLFRPVPQLPTRPETHPFHT